MLLPYCDLIVIYGERTVLNLSFQDCMRIVQSNECFKVKKNTLDGYSVYQFNYFLASYQDFVDPCGDGSLQAFELRGLTFVERPDGCYDRWLSLHKFFNVDQTTGWMLDDVRHKAVVRIQEKVDGSLIRFIRLPNGRVVAKTKFAFESEQAAAAQLIYEQNDLIRSFVNKTLDEGTAALWEIVGPWNMVVIMYPETCLRLLQLRDEATGRYLPFDNNLNLPWPNASEVALSSVESVVQECHNLEGIEGFVIQFADGQMAKVKTDWYIRRHGLLTEKINREDFLIHCVLEETIDDVIAQIPVEYVDVRAWINELTTKVVHWINREAKRIFSLVGDTYTGDRKTFAITNRADPMFSCMMRMIDRGITIENAEQFVKDYVGKQTRRYEEAKEWLRENCELVAPHLTYAEEE